MKNTVELLGHYGSDEISINDKVIFSGIYSIYCNENSKFYIGSSKNILNRLKVHFSKLINNNHINNHIQNAFNLFGINSFNFYILELCEIDKLIECEQRWFDLTQCYNREIGFNNCKIADRPTGYKHTESDKLKMSIIKKQQILDGTAPSDNLKFKTNFTHSQDTRDKIGSSNSGERNGMFGKKEEESHKLKRMENLLKAPKWNTGLTKETDVRVQKLATQTGKIPHNAISCILINLVTGEQWYGESIKHLSLVSPLSLATLIRLKNNNCGHKITELFQFKMKT